MMMPNPHHNTPQSSADVLAGCHWPPAEEHAPAAILSPVESSEQRLQHPV
jgi:hypothetical protein